MKDQLAPFLSSRYAKQILFSGIGPAGQERLLRSRATVVGLGALGTVIANLLARAGVGRLRLVDRDFVELNNLQRQVLFDERDAAERLPKAIAAAAKLRAINSEIEIEPLIADVTPRNAEQLLADSDVLLDGTDNLETRFLINDVCVKRGIPWVYGGALGATGSTMTIVPGYTPCLRCIIDQAPPPGVMASCDTEGVLGPITGLVASIESAEALKLLTGHMPHGGLLNIDLWERDFREAEVQRRSECPACGARRFEYLDGQRVAWTTVLCGRNSVQVVPPEEREISLPDLQQRLVMVGPVTYNGFLLSLRVGEREIVLFPTGRAIIRGTTDEAEARTLYARYIGN